MSAPGDGPRGPAREASAGGHAEPESGRVELAAVWAAAVMSVNFVPMSADEVTARLLRHVDRLADALDRGVPGPVTAAATDAGAALVATHCTDPESLRRTIAVLGSGLPSLSAAPADAVLAALAALGAGYADALRARTFDQQEQVKQALQRVLRLSEARFREVFRGAAVGIAISDLDGVLVQTNRALAEILGHDAGDPDDLTAPDAHGRAPGDPATGGPGGSRDPGDLGPARPRTVADLFGTAAAEALRGAYTDVLTRHGGPVRVQRGLPRRDGDEAYVIMSVSALRDERGRPTHHVTMVEDITDLHLLQERLNEQALGDVLTGLPNRQSFGLRVESALGSADPGAVVSLFHVDVDGFSLLNDRLGHDVGDKVLLLVAHRLRQVFDGEHAIIARIAADEFAVLVVVGDRTPDVPTLAERINAELAEPVYLDDVGLAVSVCVGVVHRLAGAARPDDLLRQSHAALRRAQHAGRGQWAMFDPLRDSADRARFQLAVGLPGALENGELEFEFAPLARLADGAVVASRTRLRWLRADQRTGDEQIVDHESVLGLADLAGATLPVAGWSLRAACEEVVARGGAAAPPLAVALPPAQAADPDLVAVVRSALDASGLAPHKLWLAFPVAALVPAVGLPPSDADDNLRTLADMGVPVLLHGFDGGLAALVLLEELPVRAVWLDTAAVRLLDERPESLAAKGIGDLVALAESAGATVVVDG